jgi:hypothetical protein
MERCRNDEWVEENGADRQNGPIRFNCSCNSCKI